MDDSKFAQNIYKKLDTMNEHVGSMRVDIAKMQVFVGQNTKDLADHIRRTNILEEKMNLELDKIERKVNFQITAGKIIIGLLGVIGVILGIIYDWQNILN